MSASWTRIFMGFWKLKSAFCFCNVFKEDSIFTLLHPQHIYLTTSWSFIFPFPLIVVFSLHLHLPSSSFFFNNLFPCRAARALKSLFVPCHLQIFFIVCFIHLSLSIFTVERNLGLQRWSSLFVNYCFPAGIVCISPKNNHIDYR